ncbi:MAG: hypothetical protein ACI4W1_08290 [Ruminococcus sp.]
MSLNEIEEIVDRLIVKAKGDSELSKVRFVKAYKEKEAETPVSGYLAVVSIESMTQTKSFLGNAVNQGLKGEKYTADVKVKIYAPNYEDGQDLTGIAGIFCNSIKNADDKNVIEEVCFEPIGFDENMNAMYRPCNVKIGFYLCEEAVV